MKPIWSEEINVNDTSRLVVLCTQHEEAVSFMSAFENVRFSSDPLD